MFCGKHLSMIVLVGVMLLSGCSAYGPRTMERDRVAYNNSLATSWKRQILMNIVKMRYAEPLFFTDVGEIVASYSMESSLSFGGSNNLYEKIGSLEFGGSGRYTDRPTITYKPLTGAPFLKGVMLPMPLSNVMLGVESGASVNFLFSLGVRSINGLRNERLTSRGYVPADPDYVRAVALLSELQMDGALHVGRTTLQESEDQQLTVSLGSADATPETMARVATLKELLGLDADLQTYAVVFGFNEGATDVIAIQTCSLGQILGAVSQRVDVPEADVETQCAMPGHPRLDGKRLLDRVMVQSSVKKPLGAFAAIKWQGRWFWVDDHNIVAKKVFSYIMLSFTMLDTERHEMPLQLTIPTQ